MVLKNQYSKTSSPKFLLQKTKQL